jgi:glycopeptide antibiotics resistance protein
MSFSGLLASIAAILAATLLPWSNFVGHAHWAQVQWVPFDGHRLDWFDIAANVGLFVPFGYFAGGFLSAVLPEKKTLLVLVAATLLSTSAEFLQIYSHSRFPSATDICCNLLGAALGLMLAAGRSSDNARDRPGGSKSWRRKTSKPIDAQGVIR